MIPVGAFAPLSEQHLHHIGVAVLGGYRQRGRAIIPLGTDISPLVEQRPHHLDVAILGGLKQAVAPLFLLASTSAPLSSSTAPPRHCRSGRPETARSRHCLLGIDLGSLVE